MVIRGAVVKIIGGGNTDLLALDSTYDWIRCRYDFFYKGNIPGAWNTAYTLEIASDNELYTAITNTSDLQKASIDSVGYTESFNDVYGEHEGVIVYFKDILGAANYYRYEQTRPVDTSMRHASIPLNISNGCIGSATIIVLEQGRSVYSDANTDGEQLKIVIEPAYTHTEGIATIVKIQTIDKAMHDFYDLIDKQKLGQYNPFVEPSFLPEGQFGSRAIGFFGCRSRNEGVDFSFPALIIFLSRQPFSSASCIYW